jgi:hypothetical protein
MLDLEQHVEDPRRPAGVLRVVVEVDGAPAHRGLVAEADADQPRPPRGVVVVVGDLPGGRVREGELNPVPLRVELALGPAPEFFPEPVPPVVELQAFLGDLGCSDLNSELLQAL